MATPVAATVRGGTGEVLRTMEAKVVVEAPC
jgi:hypothetical protein